MMPLLAVGGARDDDDVLIFEDFGFSIIVNVWSSPRIHTGSSLLGLLCCLDSLNA